MKLLIVPFPIFFPSLYLFAAHWFGSVRLLHLDSSGARLRGMDLDPRYLLVLHRRVPAYRCIRYGSGHKFPWLLFRINGTWCRPARCKYHKMKSYSPEGGGNIFSGSITLRSFSGFCEKYSQLLVTARKGKTTAREIPSPKPTILRFMFAEASGGVRHMNRGEEKLSGHEKGKETLIIKIYVHNVVTCFFNFFVHFSPCEVSSVFSFCRMIGWNGSFFCQTGCSPYDSFNDLTYFLLYFQFTITQIICFLLAIFGTAILLEHSTYNSRIQPMIRYTMHRLIMQSEYPPATDMLRLIQESVSTNCWVL